MAQVTYCLNPDCGHGRTQHSRNGCTNCPCTVKYMDKDMFAPK